MQAHCRPIVFGVATLLSELVFTSLCVFVLSNIIYFLTRMGNTAERYLFFIGVQQLTAFIGLATSLFLAAFIERELAVRDIFLMLIFLQLFLSGFPFQLPYITNYMSDISKLNPLRSVNSF